MEAVYTANEVEIIFYEVIRGLKELAIESNY
jgi:hypothetical protein